MKIVNPIAIQGEQLATTYLQKKNFTILDRNFRKGYGEIDIVALQNNILVFVEVKTRSQNDFGNPLEAITPWKIKTIVKTAQLYKLLHPNLPDAMRIDAIAVCLSTNRALLTIEHIENISGF